MYFFAVLVNCYLFFFLLMLWDYFRFFSFFHKLFSRMKTGNLEYLKNVLSNDFQKQFLTQVSGISLLE